MDAVQRLRVKAKDSRQLEEQQGTNGQDRSRAGGLHAPQVIIIESPSPEVVYVPTYNPTVVYGAWPYPAYPPYYYYPPGYVAGTAFLSFSVGMFVGSASWGGCNWGRGDINVNVNRYNNFNRNTTSTTSTERTTTIAGNTTRRIARAWAIATRRLNKDMAAAAVSNRCRHERTIAAAIRQQPAATGGRPEPRSRRWRQRKSGSGWRRRIARSGQSHRMNIETSAAVRKTGTWASALATSTAIWARLHPEDPRTPLSGVDNAARTRAHSSRGASSRGGMSRGGGRRR